VTKKGTQQSILNAIICNKIPVNREKFFLMTVSKKEHFLVRCHQEHQHGGRMNFDNGSDINAT
jgi:hypothetical protein